MKFLLFLLGVSFFFIFFLFSRYSESSDSFLWSLFWEWNIYVGIVLLIIFCISWPEKLSLKQSPVLWWNILDTIKYHIKTFFTQYIYYLALIFFYTWFFWVLKSIFPEIHIEYMFLFSSILVCVLSFFEERIPFSSSLMRVNTSLISLYYIFTHCLYLMWFTQDISLLWVLNIVLLFTLWYRFLFSSKNQYHSGLFFTYIYIFLYMELCVAGKYIFNSDLFLYTTISFLLWTVLSVYTKSIKDIFYIPLYITRSLGIVFLSFTISLFLFLLWEYSYSSLACFFYSLISIYILYTFHTYFQNYVALFFSFSWILLCSSYIFWFFVSDINILFSVMYIVFSFWFLFTTKVISSSYPQDKYFFQMYAFFVNLIWCFLFFFSSDLSILKISLLLLVESVFYLIVYYNFRRFKNAEISTHSL